MKSSNLFPLLLLICLAFACTKDEIKINPDNLTSCPTNSSCEYLYTESATIDSLANFKSGAYHLFWNKQVLLNICSGSFTTLWIKAPMQGNNFLIGKDALKNGFVLFQTVSPCALFVPVKPVDGYIKGIKIDNANPNNIKWMLDINVVLGEKSTGQPIDTVKVRQYFYPNFVID